MTIDTGATTEIGLSDSIANRMLAWAPSGSYLAFAEYNGPNHLHVYTVATETRENLFAGESTSQLKEFKWAPARDILAYTAHDMNNGSDAAFAKPYENDESVSELSPPTVDSGDIDLFEWSPDSKYVALVSEPAIEDGRATLYVADVDRQCYSKLSRTLVSGEEVLSQFSWSASGQYLLYQVQLNDSGHDFDFIIARIDGASQNNINGVLFTNSSIEVKSLEWMPSSDALFFEHRPDEMNPETDTLNVLEIDSMSVSSVHTDEVNGFGFWWLMAE